MVIECRKEILSRAGKIGGAAFKHIWTDDERDIVRRDYRHTNTSASLIAAMLSRPGDPVTRHAVKGVVAKMGIARPAGRRWSDDDEEILRDLYCRFEIAVVARKMKRSRSAIVLKAKRIGLNRMMRDGWYTKADVCELFGVDHHWVTARVNSGALVAKSNRPDLAPAQKGGSYWRIQEKDLRSFIRRYPQELQGRNVDMLQLVDLLSGVNCKDITGTDSKKEE